MKSMWYPKCPREASGKKHPPNWGLCSICSSCSIGSFHCLYAFNIWMQLLFFFAVFFVACALQVQQYAETVSDFTKYRSTTSQSMKLDFHYDTISASFSEEYQKNKASQVGVIVLSLHGWSPVQQTMYNNQYTLHSFLECELSHSQLANTPPCSTCDTTNVSRLEKLARNSSTRDKL